MDQVQQWGIDVIIAIQQYRTPYLDYFFKVITTLGDSIFYLIFLPIIFWCSNTRVSVRLFAIFFLSSWINSELKNIFEQPRPYNLNPDVKIGETGGPGLPSGHAQGSFILWTYLACWVQKGWFYAFSVSIIILIAFSRVYLGVHFPTDILGGWIIACLLLLAFYGSIEKIEKWLKNLTLIQGMLITFTIPFLLALMLPTKWSVSPMALLAGFGPAFYIERKYVKFDRTGNLLQLLLRCAIGIPMLIALHFSLGLVAIDGVAMGLVSVFIHFFVIGIWISLCSPWIFSRIRFL
ncbi:MAG: phosphatase PAP2 family protein [Spirochaetota bacterium]|nr:phosphatase PAP2 family protein [Spirochaetota bacterium]